MSLPKTDVLIDIKASSESNTLNDSMTENRVDQNASAQNGKKLSENNLEVLYSLRAALKRIGGNKKGQESNELRKKIFEQTTALINLLMECSKQSTAENEKNISDLFTFLTDSLSTPKEDLVFTDVLYFLGYCYQNGISVAQDKGKFRHYMERIENCTPVLPAESQEPEIDYSEDLLNFEINRTKDTVMETQLSEKQKKDLTTFDAAIAQASNNSNVSPIVKKLASEISSIIKLCFSDKEHAVLIAVTKLQKFVDSNGLSLNDRFVNFMSILQQTDGFYNDLSLIQNLEAPTKEELEKKKFNDLIERAKDAFDKKKTFSFKFKEWEVSGKKKPEIIKFHNSITLKEEGLKLLIDTVDVEIIKSGFTKEFLSRLYEKSEEKEKAEQHANKNKNEIEKQELFTKFTSLPDAVLNVNKKMGALKKEVHELLFKTKNSLAINALLIEDEQYGDRTPKKKRDKSFQEKKLNNLKAEVEKEKFDVRFDLNFMKYQETISKFEELYLKSLSTMEKALDSENDLKAMQEVWNQFDGIQKELTSYVNSLNAIHDRLTQIKKELEEQQGFYKNVEIVKSAELDKLKDKKNKDPKLELQREEIKAVRKQIEALAYFEKEFAERKQRFSQKEADAKKREEERNKWKEAARAKHEEFLASQLKKDGSSDSDKDSDDSTNGSADVKTSADTKTSGDRPRNRVAPTHTLDRAGAFSAQFGDRKIKKEIDRQLEEGRDLLTKAAQFNDKLTDTLGDNKFNSELTQYALLGKLGQILEAMKKPRVLDKQDKLTRIAKEVRNAIFHGGSNIIPNVEDTNSTAKADRKEAFEKKKVEDFITKLTAANLELISNEKIWQSKEFDTYNIPELFVQMALHPKEIPASKKFTAAELYAEIEKKAEGLTFKHDAKNCAEQLSIYHAKLAKIIEVLELGSVPHIDPVIMKNAIGYILGRIGVYMKPLDNIDGASYRDWKTKVNATCLKLQKFYIIDVIDTVDEFEFYSVTALAAKLRHNQAVLFQAPLHAALQPLVVREPQLDRNVSASATPMALAIEK